MDTKREQEQTNFYRTKNSRDNGHHRMIKKSIHQMDITTLNIMYPMFRASS